MSFWKRKSVKAAVITAICLFLLMFVNHFSGRNPVEGILKTVFAPIQHGFSYIAYKADQFKTFIWEMDTYKEQNEELILRVNELEKYNKDTEHYREENDSLQNLLELKESIDDYTTLAASVISYSSNNWYDTVEINKGSRNGVSVGNSVITDKGVVGVVTEVGFNWATVSSIMNTGSATGVRVTRTGGIGVVEGDGTFLRQGLCKMSFLDRNSGIIVGDLLETSGSGGVYPPGIMVGKVKDISSDNSGTLEYATVEPAVDFSKLYAVIVINGMNR